MAKKVVSQVKPVLDGALKRQAQRAIECYIETARLEVVRRPDYMRSGIYQDAFNEFRDRFCAAAFAAFVDLDLV